MDSRQLVLKHSQGLCRYSPSTGCVKIYAAGAQFQYEYVSAQPVHD